jgi:photosystem II stability/assembly factor-like uncharacterized protein
MKNKFLGIICLFFFGTMLKAQVWYQVETNTHKKLNTIDFPSASIGYVGGNDSILLKSIDGGKHGMK